jgi:degradative hydroxymethylglutaryl-CoA reductase
MSDVAVYSNRNAQPTSGAGAIALLIGPDPVVIIESQRASNFMNAYDFYKPELAHDYPTVDGKLSTDLYIKSLIKCWERLKENGAMSLKDFDFFCFHCPFTKQVRKAYLALMFNELKKEKAFAQEFDIDPKQKQKLIELSEKNISFYNKKIQQIIKPLFFEEVQNRLEAGLHLPSMVGNIYTGSLYLSLISIFYVNRDQLESLQNKRIMLYSYGSGLASSILQLTISNSNLHTFVNSNRIQTELNSINLLSCSDYFKLQKENEQIFGKKNIKTVLSDESTYHHLSADVSKQLWEETYYLRDIGPTYKRQYVFYGPQKTFNLFTPKRTGSLSAMRLSNKKKIRNMALEERQTFLSEKFSDYSLSRHLQTGGLSEESADLMTENCIGRVALPLSVVTGLFLNGKEYTVPMSTEEASVVAAANRSLKTIREFGGGFWGYNTRNVIRGQIYIVDFQSLESNTFERKISEVDDFNIDLKISPRKHSNSLSKNSTKNMISPSKNLSSLVINSGFESRSILGDPENETITKIISNFSSFRNHSSEAKRKEKQKFFIDISASIQNILQNKNTIINLINEKLCANMYKLGGGAFDLYCKVHDQTSFSVSLLLDVVDAMGANTINTTLEKLKPFIMSKLIIKTENENKKTPIDSSPILMSICSNLTPERVTRVGFKVPVDAFGYSGSVQGLEVCQRICMAARMAKLDLFRAVTHNKGIMNGIVAVLLALGQDTRAVEAGCHVYSVYRNGQYQSLSEFYLEQKDDETFLCGELEIPLSIGTVGGVLGMNPLYKSFLNNMKIKTSKELSQVVACIGLANNLAALRALVTEGIQKGHMRLHAKNMALTVGVPYQMVDEAVKYMEKVNKFTMQSARDFLAKSISKAKETKKIMKPKL